MAVRNFAYLLSAVCFLLHCILQVYEMLGVIVAVYHFCVKKNWTELGETPIVAVITSTNCYFYFFLESSTAELLWKWNSWAVMFFFPSYKSWLTRLPKALIDKRTDFGLVSRCWCNNVGYFFMMAPRNVDRETCTKSMTRLYFRCMLFLACCC